MEKLVLDNEICGQVLRMTKGISPKEDFPAIFLIKELLNEGHLLISNHTHQYLQQEQHFPGDIINRTNLSLWENAGSKIIQNRANAQIEALIDSYQETSLSNEQENELLKLMQFEAKKHGIDQLPTR